MRQLLTVSLSDFKLIFRDPALRVFLFLPIMILVLLNGVLPWLVREFPVMEDYMIYAVVLVTIQVTQMFGLIYSIVLIEEKEQEVAKIYGIMPVSLIAFTLFRMLIPVIITALITWFILLVQPFYDIPPGSGLLFSFLTALLVPPYVLAVSVVSKNKMEGMIWIKVVNLAIVLPAAAFFVPQNLSWLFGILPTHWAFQGLYHLILHENFAIYLLIAAVFLFAVTALLLRRFSKTHFA